MTLMIVEKRARVPGYWNFHDLFVLLPHEFVEIVSMLHIVKFQSWCNARRYNMAKHTFQILPLTP